MVANKQYKKYKRNLKKKKHELLYVDQIIEVIEKILQNGHI
jgi:hypothetical protein